MSRRNEYFIEDLLNKTEAVIQELGILDSDEDSDRIFTEQASLSAKTQFEQNEIEGQNYRVDGSVDIMISADRMTASANFYPPSEGMQPLTYQKVAEAIAEKKISYGIKTEIIEEQLFKCNTENQVIKNLIIAAGRPAVQHISEHLVIAQELLAPDSLSSNSKSKIDYRKRSPFKLVKKGQTVAEIIPEQPGTCGWNVLGEEIGYRTKSVKSYARGKNTEISGNWVTASCDGTFELSDKLFNINEVLQLQSDVDYRTGNIDFPGDIIINGEIRDGFTIKSGGSIYASGTMDASTVECENDLYVGLGIIGRKKGSIKTAGKIKAKFIENCFVETGGIIILDAGIMNSEIYTNDKITLGKKGVIVGGRIYTQNGLIATQIGTMMGPRTEIYCGVDYKVENKLKWIRDNTMKIATKLNQIREQIAKNRTEVPKLIELRDKLQLSLRKLNEIAGALVYKLDKNDNAEVVVRKSVYPGVYIEICHVSYVVNREMSSVRFKLDKNNGVIRVETL